MPLCWTFTIRRYFVSRYHILTPRETVRRPGEPLYKVLDAGDSIRDILDRAKDHSKNTDIKKLYVFDTERDITVWACDKGRL